MYNMRKNPIYKSQPSLISKAKHENFKPQVEWKDDQYNRMLLIQLPGFKREEIRVQLDNAGKLFIKGSRLATDNKCIDVDQSFDVPKDVISDKISGKFEDGRLTLIMPKREIAEAKTVAKEKTVLNEATKEEESKQEEEKHKEGKIEKEKKDDNISHEKTTSNEANQMEKSTITEAMASLVKETKSRITDAMHSKPTQEKEKESVSTDTAQNESNSKAEAEEMPKNNLDNNNKNEDVENLKEKSEGIIHQKEKKFEQAIQEAKVNYNEKVETIPSEVKSEEKRKERMQKMKSKMIEIYRETPKEIRKKINKMRRGEDGWLNSKYIDGAVEKMNQNRNIIAVAVMAFTVGLYVSHKLKARRG